jgi:hypothetical protein
MTEELNKTEARQGDARRMNWVVLVVATPLAFVLMALIYFMWA